MHYCSTWSTYGLGRLLRQAQFVLLAKDVQAAMRAGFWKISLREPAASGAVAALEASMSLALEVVAGCTDDWDTPDVASARLAAHHLSQVPCGVAYTCPAALMSGGTAMNSFFSLPAFSSLMAYRRHAVKSLMLARAHACNLVILWENGRENG